MINYEELWSGRYKTRNRTRMMPYMAMGCFEITIQKFGRQPVFSKSVIDWGCGNGYAMRIFENNGFKYEFGIDIASNSVDASIFTGNEDRFVVGDVTTLDFPYTADIGFCADVLEHLDEIDVDDAITNIKNHSDLAMFFSVGLASDKFYGQELHSTIKPFEWWKEKFGQYAPVQVSGRIEVPEVAFFFMEV